MWSPSRHWLLSSTPDAAVLLASRGVRGFADGYVSVLLPVYLLGLGFDGPGRLELLKSIKALRPKLAVLVFSKHSEDLYARRSFKAGAAGYVTADSSRADVVHAMQKVMSGGRYVSPQLAETFAADLESQRGDPPHLALSDREFEVMQLLASGKTVGEIASMLFLSVPTISTHRARLLLKLSIRNNAQLTRYALENKLID